MTTTLETPEPTAGPAPQVGPRDRIGLNAANFFLAELTGVVMPFLAKFLAERGWRDDAIQYAAAACGLGVFLAQTPAGVLTDRFRDRRTPARRSVARGRACASACYRSFPTDRLGDRSAGVPRWGGAGVLRSAAGGAGPRFSRARGPAPGDGREPGVEPRREHRGGGDRDDRRDVARTAGRVLHRRRCVGSCRRERVPD